MSTVLNKISKEIGIKEDELVSSGVRSYIKSELGKIEFDGYMFPAKEYTKIMT